MALQPGDPAPDALLPTHTLERQRLSALWAERPLILLFFPLAFTSICTEELCTFRDREEFFSHRRDRGLTGRMAAVIQPA